MKRKFVSFDVFDTCLIRRCGCPYKIWDLMADRLFEKDDSKGRLSFAGNRSLAEKNISKTNPYPTLKDIYDELNVTQWGFEQNSIMDLEMEIEEQELFPNPELLKTVNQYREKGFKIAFISDMYLPTEFIRNVLVKYGFCQEDELVFVSAHCKAGKYDGKLFDYVLRETKTKARQWIHYGDNKHSDYYVPKLKGIKAFLVLNTDFTDEEKKWMHDARFYKYKHEIELWSGLCRLTRLQNDSNFATVMAADFITSVYIPYVANVLKIAKTNGIKKLFFLARDAHIFLEMAKVMKEDSSEIECRYLKVSRCSIYSCVFFEANDYELSIVINNALGQTVGQFLEHIGIDWENLSIKSKSSFCKNVKLNTRKKINLFKRVLLENDSELLKNSSEKKRNLMLKYMHQEGVFDSNAAMVDLGWTGGCRVIFNYILQREKRRVIPFFYWGYVDSLLYGSCKDDLFIYNKQFDSSSNASCGVLFFEKYTSLNASGSSKCYEQVGNRIVPKEEEKDVSIQWLMDINESTVLSHLRNLSNVVFSDEAFFDIFLCCGLRQEARIIESPTKKLVNFFHYIKFENYGVNVPMVRKLFVKDILALLVWGIPTSMIWTEAAIIKTFGPFASLFVRFYKFSSQTAFANRLRLWWENRM